MPKENESISLGKIGIVDGGVYDPKKTYNSGTFVLHNGSTWLAMKDNLTGATPEEGTNWKYLARGFASEMLSLITAIDSQGLLGSKGAEVTGQALIDKLADMAANKLIQKASMSNVQANDQNKVPTSALAYAMNRSITQNEEAITQLNRDIESGYLQIHVKTATILFMIRECNFVNGKCSVPATELFGFQPKWGASVCQALLLNESVVAPSMAYDNSSNYVITLQNRLDYTGVAWIIAAVIANAS